jgi:hypothetical protein
LPEFLRLSAGIMILLMIYSSFVYPSFQPLLAAAIPASLQSDLYYGYGPSELLQFKGIPIFSAGDELWMEYTGNNSLPLYLTDPQGNIASSAVLYQRGQPYLIHTFAKSDKQGSWNIIVNYDGMNYTFQLYLFQNLASLPLLIDGNGVYANGTGFISVSTNLGRAYSAEYCLLPSNFDSYFNASPYRLEPQPGSFNLNISSIKQGARAELYGSIYSPKIMLENASFVSVEVDFISNYAYFTDSMMSGIAIQNLLVATSFLPVSSELQSNENASYNLTTTFFLHPREGRYEVRVFITGAYGTIAFEKEALVLASGSFFIPQNCSPITGSLSSFKAGFQISGTKSLPSIFMMMYGINGVESYSYHKLNLNISDIRFLTYPWNTSPTGLSISLMNEESVESNASSGNDLYLLLNRLPAVVNISLDYLGYNIPASLILDKGGLHIVYLNSSKLYLKINQSNISASDKLFIYSQTGQNITEPLDGSPLYLPAGNYNVTVLHDGQRQSANVSLVNGKESTIMFEFKENTLNYAYILLLSGIAGTALSISLWGYYFIKRLKR